MNIDHAAEAALNRICPYYTMFPLRFPYRILCQYARPDDGVLDPFCGRGTTNYAARLLGMSSSAVDSNPVAVAITQAKAATATPDEVLREYDMLLQTSLPVSVPQGAFWRLAYHPDVLDTLCRIRQQRLALPQTGPRAALTGIILGALHGPKSKHGTSYFSNQSPRTFSPKPGYATRYWSMHKLWPDYVDVREIIAVRARRYYGHTSMDASCTVVLGDARKEATWAEMDGASYRWIITSPPYYGLRTYQADQWIRAWFLGGCDRPMYRDPHQLTHNSPESFAAELRTVWRNVLAHAADGARLVIRFGGIHDRSADPLAIIKDSLRGSGWRVCTRRSAGVASRGRRQADHFQPAPQAAREEFDIWACLDEAPSTTTDSRQRSSPTA
jgi:hypothetical protein